MAQATREEIEAFTEFLEKRRRNPTPQESYYSLRAIDAFAGRSIGLATADIEPAVSPLDKAQAKRAIAQA